MWDSLGVQNSTVSQPRNSLSMQNSMWNSLSMQNSMWNSLSMQISMMWMWNSLSVLIRIIPVTWKQVIMKHMLSRMRNYQYQMVKPGMTRACLAQLVFVDMISIFSMNSL